MSAPNKEMARIIFEAILAGEEDLTDQERQELVTALNLTLTRWRTRPRVPMGPDVSGYWLEGAGHAKRAVQ
jgi:hypothetical protein